MTVTHSPDRRPSEKTEAMMHVPSRPLPLTHEETPAERDERRRKLLRLDRCLDLLESAMEKDRTVVDSQSAAILAHATPLLSEGMALPDAIEVVLLLQEAYMRPVTRPVAWTGVRARL